MKLFGIDLPPGRSVEGWDNWPVNARQFALDSVKSWGLSKIVNIRAHIHKVVLCSDYLWRDFHAGPLGSLQYYHRNLAPGERGHSRISVPHQFDTECRICTHPTKGYLPQSVIVLVGPRVQDIRLFADHYGGSWISSAEYGLDMICANPGDAQNLFNLLKRYLYVRNLQKQRLIKPEEQEQDNRTIYYGKYKLYERGPNSMRRADGGWPLDHVDRVRWEYSTPGTELNERGLFFVADLLQDPRFYQVTRLANQKLRFGFGKFGDACVLCSNPPSVMLGNEPLIMIESNHR